MSKKMNLEQRKLVNSLIEYPETPNKVIEPVTETVQQEPKSFELDVGEFKAVALLKLPIEEHNSWVNLILTIKDGIVVDIVMGEPNLKAISQEQCKIDFVKQFLGA